MKGKRLQSLYLSGNKSRKKLNRLDQVVVRIPRVGAAAFKITQGENSRMLVQDVLVFMQCFIVLMMKLNMKV